MVHCTMLMPPAHLCFEVLVDSNYDICNLIFYYFSSQVEVYSLGRLDALVSFHRFILVMVALLFHLICYYFGR